MKKLVLTLFLVLLFSSQNTFAQTQEPLKAQLTMQDVVVFSNNKNTLFGLKDKSGNIVVDAQYKKLIRLGTSSWIINKKNKYGIMDSSGNILV